MSIELTALGKKCNLGCSYCYQGDERIAANNSAPPYDMNAMKQALIDEGVGKPDWQGNTTGWTLFGGEALLMPVADIEELLKWSAGLGASVGCQTAGNLITERHIDLFKKYGVSVGFSIDGPDDLNDARQAMDPKATRATTAMSMRNLDRFLAEKMSVSLIVTLTHTNVGTSAKLDRLVAWLLELRDKGLQYVNLHMLEPHGSSSLSLTQLWQTHVMRVLRSSLVGFKHVAPFDDMRKSLLQESGSNCIWNFCDPYTTAAVHGVEGDGSRGNCGRTNKNGVSYEKSNTSGHERHLALYLTPQEHGGCAECRFFIPCGGGNCPGEGIGGDWRAKTVHCDTIKSLLGDMEMEVFLEGKEPVSQSLRRPGMEAALIAKWTGVGVSPTTGNVEHGDKPHGDKPHGDHTDLGESNVVH